MTKTRFQGANFEAEKCAEGGLHDRTCDQFQAQKRTLLKNRWVHKSVISRLPQMACYSEAIAFPSVGRRSFNVLMASISLPCSVACPPAFLVFFYHHPHNTPPMQEALPCVLPYAVASSCHSITSLRFLLLFY